MPTICRWLQMTVWKIAPETEESSLFWKKKKNPDVALDARYSDYRSAYRSFGFPQGTRLHATIRLPSEDRMFPVILEIVSKQNDLCRCNFIEIHEDAENLLHSYILNLQKRKIRHNQEG